MLFFHTLALSFSTAMAVPFINDKTYSTYEVSPADESVPGNQAVSNDETVPQILSEVSSGLPSHESVYDDVINGITVSEAELTTPTDEFPNKADYVASNEAIPQTSYEVAIDPVGYVLDQMGKKNQPDKWDSPCTQTRSICCTEDVQVPPSPEDFRAVRIKQCSASTFCPLRFHASDD